MPFHNLKLPVAALTVVAALAMPAQAEDSVSPETVLATVDGTEITLGHMIALRSGLPEQYAQIPPEALFDGILDQLVQQTLLSQSLDGDPSPLARLTVENETRAILASEAINKLMNGAVTEDAIAAAYADEYLNADPATEYNAAHILVATEDEAKALVEKLNEGEDFAALAREFSTGPSGPNGGDLGWFGDGVMVAPFFEAVTALQPGATSAPVQTDFGWHLIQLKETRSKDRPELDEVRAELADTLRNAAFEAHVETLEKNATIERGDTSGIDPAILNDATRLEQ